jgi:hypothetical protein
MLLILRAAGVLSLLVAAGVRAITPIDDGPYHVFDSCQPIIDLYIDAAVNFTSCALNKSLPPVVCTNCMDEYKKLLNVFHWIREEVGVSAFARHEMSTEKHDGTRQTVQFSDHAIACRVVCTATLRRHTLIVGCVCVRT